MSCGLGITVCGAPRGVLSRERLASVPLERGGLALSAPSAAGARDDARRVWRGAHIALEHTRAAPRGAHIALGHTRTTPRRCAVGSGTPATTESSPQREVRMSNVRIAPIEVEQMIRERAGVLTIAIGSIMEG